jgi:glyoxalase family protein
MEQLVTGIHHVTAIAGSSQKNLDFYVGILGLRLVKKTVNFDAPEVYHLYYGDEVGTPGSVLTFFPYEGLIKGRQGKGMLNTTTFSVPHSSIDYWMERLKHFGINYTEPQERFEREAVIYFEDIDGLGLELVFNDVDRRQGFLNGPIPAEYTIRGFYNVEIWEEGYELTSGLLTGQLDHKLIAEKGNRFRFATNDKPGSYVDVVCTPDSLKGLKGSGTVHHIAFITEGKESQEKVRAKIVERKLNVTPVLDRKYFTSIYFREPGGVLFEVATTTPGFMLDEPKEHLGEALMLPDWLEKDRESMAQKLPCISIDINKFR